MRTLAKDLVFIFSVGFLLLFIFCLVAPAQQDKICEVRAIPHSMGSGSFITKTRILTAWHVVYDINNDKPKEALRVEFGNTYHAAKIIAKDEPNDLAILEVAEPFDVEPIELGLRPLDIGDAVTFHGIQNWNVETREGEIISKFSCLDGTYQHKLNVPANWGMSGCPLCHDGKLYGVIVETTIMNIPNPSGGFDIIPVCGLATPLEPVLNLIAGLK